MEGGTKALVIEILSFSCSVLFVVTADGDHLAILNCKKSKWLNAQIIATESWYNSFHREIFILCYFLATDAILTGLFLFDFETTQCKNHFDSNLVKIH